MGKRWYVVQSKSKCEIEAYDNLRSQCYKTFYPHTVETRVMRGKTVAQVAPLFPSYLFVQFDIKRAKWRSILGTRGVVKLLGSTDKYASPLPEGFIEELLKRADKRGYVLIQSAGSVLQKYKPGDRLTVKDGVFTGLSGTCKTIREDFAVLILALQAGDFEINLPLKLVEPA